MINPNKNGLLPDITQVNLSCNAAWVGYGQSLTDWLITDFLVNGLIILQVGTFQTEALIR